MAVVRNLMIRIGADFSAAQKGMQGATRELSKFRRDTERTAARIEGKKGLGGIGAELRNLNSTVTSSLSQIRGAKGIGGIASALGSLRPVMGTATKGLSGLGSAAGGAGAAFGGAALGIGAFVAALSLAVIGIYQASQTAVKFEADIGRLNMQLKGNSREFMDWARSVGLAKSSAAEMGATFGTLLSSFISDSKELANQTKQIVQSTRVVASATGRTIEDVTERIRSGLLGNTEAIEDLGIFVNISMIESTNAFKKFANGKHWNQLDFRVQQQIRLQAILEQATARYGTSLQNNVMTKQDQLIEQWKDIKLNLSQAFLPIWDAVLPALTKLAETLADVTEQIARFVYWIRGWDYDEMTRGGDKATERIEDQGGALDDLADSAKTARKELAAFDEINQLGDFGGGGSGKGNTPDDSLLPIDDKKSGGLKKALEDLRGPWEIIFKPIQFPDIGAFATAIIQTINDLAMQAKAKMAQMWNDLKTLATQGLQGIIDIWNEFAKQFGLNLVPNLISNIARQWSDFWNGLLADTSGFSLKIQNLINQFLSSIRDILIATTQQLLQIWRDTFSNILIDLSSFIQLFALDWERFKEIILSIKVTFEQLIQNWKTTLITMANELKIFITGFIPEWELFKETIRSIADPLNIAKEVWRETLDYMQNQLNTYRPYLEWGWFLIGASAEGIIPSLQNVRQVWNDALTNMLNVVIERTQPILAHIEAVKQAWASMMEMIGEPIRIPDIKLPTIQLPDMSHLLEPLKNVLTPTPQENVDPSRNLPVLGYLLRGLDSVGQAVEESGVGGFLRGILIPGASIGGVGSALNGSAAQAGSLLDKLRGLLQGAGIAVPALASGGIVTGPTLAMIGEAGTEAVIPLEDTSFVDTLASAIGTAVVAAQQVAQGGGAQQADREIVIQVDGATLARVMYPYQQQEQQRRGTTVIKEI